MLVVILLCSLVLLLEESGLRLLIRWETILGLFSNEGFLLVLDTSFGDSCTGSCAAMSSSDKAEPQKGNTLADNHTDGGSSKTANDTEQSWDDEQVRQLVHEPVNAAVMTVAMVIVMLSVRVRAVVSSLVTMSIWSDAMTRLPMSTHTSATLAFHSHHLPRLVSTAFGTFNHVTKGAKNDGLCTAQGSSAVLTFGLLDGNGIDLGDQKFACWKFDEIDSDGWKLDRHTIEINDGKMDRNNCAFLVGGFTEWEVFKSKSETDWRRCDRVGPTDQRSEKVEREWELDRVESLTVQSECVVSIIDGEVQSLQSKSALRL